MNKAELVKAVAAKTKLAETQVRSALDGALDEIVTQVRAGGEVRLSDFGSFKRVHKEARKARNPATGATVDVPAKNAVKFKPASNVAQAMG